MTSFEIATMFVNKISRSIKIATILKENKICFLKLDTAMSEAIFPVLKF